MMIGATGNKGPMASSAPRSPNLVANINSASSGQQQSSSSQSIGRGGGGGTARIVSTGTGDNELEGELQLTPGEALAFGLPMVASAVAVICIYWAIKQVHPAEWCMRAYIP